MLDRSASSYPTHAFCKWGHAFPWQQGPSYTHDSRFTGRLSYNNQYVLSDRFAVEFLREESSVDAATRRGEKAERVIMIRVVPHRRQILPLICRRLSVCVCSHVSVSRGVARYLQR